MTPWVGAAVAVLAVGAAMLAGVYVVAILDRVLADLLAGRGVRLGAAAQGPWREAAHLLLQGAVRTERPDAEAWALAPALLAALAAGSVTVLPVAPGVSARRAPR